MRKWEVMVDGVKHEIEYKIGLSRKIIVDGEPYKAKSSNMFINVVDYGISFGDTECKLVVIGNKADLAVNGIFLGSKKPYEPISNMPAWIGVLVGLSIIGGWFFAGLLGLCVGLIGSTCYIQLGLRKKVVPVIGCFIGCSAIQLILRYTIVASLASRLYQF